MIWNSSLASFTENLSCKFTRIQKRQHLHCLILSLLIFKNYKLEIESRKISWVPHVVGRCDSRFWAHSGRRLSISSTESILAVGSGTSPRSVSSSSIAAAILIGNNTCIAEALSQLTGWLVFLRSIHFLWPCSVNVTSCLVAYSLLTQVSLTPLLCHCSGSI